MDNKPPADGEPLHGFVESLEAHGVAAGSCMDGLMVGMFQLAMERWHAEESFSNLLIKWKIIA